MSVSALPFGPAGQASRDGARRSEEYREARGEYVSIRELRKRNWIAAHIRERHYELGLTQQDVAGRAETWLPDGSAWTSSKRLRNRF